MLSTSAAASCCSSVNGGGGGDAVEDAYAFYRSWVLGEADRDPEVAAALAAQQQHAEVQGGTPAGSSSPQQRKQRQQLVRGSSSLASSSAAGVQLAHSCALYKPAALVEPSLREQIARHLVSTSACGLGLQSSATSAAAQKEAAAAAAPPATARAPPRGWASARPDFSHRQLQALRRLFPIRQPALKPAAALPRDYVLLDVIGQGAHGVAYKARHLPTGRVVCIKTLDAAAGGGGGGSSGSPLAAHARQAQQRELAVLASCGTHPNIIRLLDCGRSAAVGCASGLQLVMEWADGGDLAGVISRHAKAGSLMSEEQLLGLFVQLLLALAHVHSLGIIHRDVKAGNIFLTSAGLLKLGDFGIAKVLDAAGSSGSSSRPVSSAGGGAVPSSTSTSSGGAAARAGMRGLMAQSFVGTPHCMAPEVVCCDGPYGSKADIWAAGCVLFEMAALKPAFTGLHMAAIFRRIKRGRVQQLPCVYSRQLQALHSRIMRQDANERPSCQELLADELLQPHLARYRLLLQQLGLELPPPPEAPDHHSCGGSSLATGRMLAASAMRRSISYRSNGSPLRRSLDGPLLRRSLDGPLRRSLDARLQFLATSHSTSSSRETLEQALARQQAKQRQQSEVGDAYLAQAVPVLHLQDIDVSFLKLRSSGSDDGSSSGPSASLAAGSSRLTASSTAAAVSSRNTSSSGGGSSPAAGGQTRTATSRLRRLLHAMCLHILPAAPLSSLPGGQPEGMPASVLKKLAAVDEDASLRGGGIRAVHALAAAARLHHQQNDAAAADSTYAAQAWDDLLRQAGFGGAAAHALDPVQMQLLQQAGEAWERQRSTESSRNSAEQECSSLQSGDGGARIAGTPQAAAGDLASTKQHPQDTTAVQQQPQAEPAALSYGSSGAAAASMQHANLIVPPAPSTVTAAAAAMPHQQQQDHDSMLSTITEASELLSPGSVAASSVRGSLELPKPTGAKASSGSSVSSRHSAERTSAEARRPQASSSSPAHAKSPPAPDPLTDRVEEAPVAAEHASDDAVRAQHDTHPAAGCTPAAAAAAMKAEQLAMAAAVRRLQALLAIGAAGQSALVWEV